jgi:hypothetical protein
MRSFPNLGFGVGLRAEHYGDVLKGRPRVDWFEAITENYIDTRGRPLWVLEQVRRDYALALHGVGLSIGSVDPLDKMYLRRLRALADRIEPSLITDHLCWTGVSGNKLYDLLPLPYTEEALAHVVTRVQAVQDALGRRILLENPSTYIAFRHSAMSEWEFLAEVADSADCGILLDINNVYVSAVNHGFGPLAYINGLPPNRIGQFHLAGHTDMGGYLFDTHSAPVCDSVWRLYAHAVERFGPVSTLIEWDAEIPTFARLHREAERARTIAERTHDRTSTYVGRAAAMDVVSDPKPGPAAA